METYRRLSAENKANYTRELSELETSIKVCKDSKEKRKLKRRWAELPSEIRKKEDELYQMYVGPIGPVAPFRPFVPDKILEALE